MKKEQRRTSEKSVLEARHAGDLQVDLEEVNLEGTVPSDIDILVVTAKDPGAATPLENRSRFQNMPSAWRGMGWKEQPHPCLPSKRSFHAGF